MYLNDIVFAQYSNQLKMSNLHTFVLNVPVLQSSHWDNFTNAVLPQQTSSQWQTVWLPQKNLTVPMVDSLSGCKVLAIGNEKPGEYRNLHHFRTDSSNNTPYFVGSEFSMPSLTCMSMHGPSHVECLELFTSLQRLSLVNVTATETLFSAIEPLKNLQSLSLIGCTFDIALMNRDEAIEAFKTLIKTIPDMKEFELSGILIPNQCDWKFWDHLVPCLVGWTQLVKLSLDCLWIHDEKFLVELSMSCCDIETVSLISLGTAGHCKFLNRLCQALPNWKKLKHFKFEQKNIGSIKSLIQTLQECPTVEKISIIDASSYTAFDVKFYDVMNLLHAAPNLVFLYICKNFLRSAWRKKLLQLVRETFSCCRPALKVFFENEPDNIYVPWIHKDMVYHPECISLQRTNGTWYYPQVTFD